MDPLVVPTDVGRQQPRRRLAGAVQASQFGMELISDGNDDESSWNSCQTW